MKNFPRGTLALPVLLQLVGAAFAQEPPVRETPGSLQEWNEAVLGGRWWLKLRYRLESVDQDGFSRDASASTLRTVLGWESAPWHGASVVLEFEDVSVVGGERYDSTVNGETSFPVVADPEGAEVNQAHLELTPVDDATVRLGRQVITLDDHRFVGDVGWRQNQQTYDAASVSWQPCEGLGVFYSYVGNVNRVFGEDSPQGDHRMASHLLNAGYDFEGVGRLVGYAYLLDYDSAVGLSSSTVGARFTGMRPLDAAEIRYAAAFAVQTDAGENPNDLDQEYGRLELGAEAGGYRVTAGGELLGGSGDPGDAFQTPLATLHAFNGWADEFLTTPDTGLQDLFLALGKRWDDVDLQLVWHDFQSDAGSIDYGSELDANLTWSACENVSVGLKVADYQADAFASDTTKAWLWVAYAP